VRENGKVAEGVKWKNGSGPDQVREKIDAPATYYSLSSYTVMGRCRKNSTH